MLMIILIGSEKGGVGKSTLAMNLAVWFASKGKDVVILDADRQSTSANWAQDRAETDKVKVSCVRQYDNLKSTIKDLDGRYNIIIIDCQGRISQEMRTGLLMANAVIVPFKPSQLDLDTLPSMLEVIGEAQDFNAELQSYAVMTMCPTNPHTSEVNQTKDFFSHHPNITLLSHVIHERKTYRDAAGSGLGAIELNNDKATTEVDNLFKEFVRTYSSRKKEAENGK
jgi:chromosome partitioning protein